MVLEPQENDTHGWITVDLSELDPGGESQEVVPFKLVANRFESSSPDSEAFIHNPLQALQDAQVNEGILEGLNLEGWKVSTFVVNHHQTLYAKHLYALASVNPDDETVGVTVVKKRPNNS